MAIQTRDNRTYQYAAQGFFAQGKADDDRNANRQQGGTSIFLIAEIVSI